MLPRELGPIIGKHLLTKPVKGDTFKKAGWNNSIGVNVVADDDNGAPAHSRDRAKGKAGGGHGRGHGVVLIIWRTSHTLPAIAAAATIAGLISRVRPVAEPWRPLKLRLLELALI